MKLMVAKMSNEYLHIAFHNINPSDYQRFENIINDREMAQDWLRYSGNCWIVWTDKKAMVWEEKFLPVLKKDEQFLILGLRNGSTVGFLPKSIS